MTGDRTMPKSIQSYTGYFEATEGSEDLLMDIPTKIIVSGDWRADDVLSMNLKSGRIFITNRFKSEREHSPTTVKQP